MVLTENSFYLQLKQSMRVVTTEEYDIAALTTPSCCPLVVMGDCRSGQQLLDDAPMDMKARMAHLVCTHLGRASLNNVLAYLECRLATEAKQQGSEDSNEFPVPVSCWERGIKSSNFSVERPFTYRISHIEFEKESPTLQFMLRHGWAHLPARRIWNFGFKADRIMRNFNSLPDHICCGLVRLLNAINNLLQRSKHTIEDAGHLQGFSALTAGPCAATTGTSDPSSDEYQEDVLWGEETVLGLMQQDLEPGTQRRLRVAVNSRTASFWGMHKEEMLARISNHDLSVQYSDVDGMYAFIFDMQSTLFDTSDLYIRMSFGEGESVRAFLVCLTKYKVFNSQGQLVKVI